MLVQFSVENFKSFNELTTWSLRATADARLPHHIATNEKGKGGAQIGILRAAAIYGANAAGKSNLVLAMSFAQRLILNGTRGEERLGVQPFKLGDGKEKPSRFEFIFRHNDVLYSYGFAATARRIHEEWLFATTTSKETRLFERVTNDDNKTVAEFGASLKRGAGGAFLDFIAQGTRPNQLLLTECFERNVEAVKPVREWFDEVLQVIRADDHYQELLVEVHSNRSFVDFLAQFIKAAGTGVENIMPAKLDFDLARFLTTLPYEERSEIEQSIEQLTPGDIATVTNNLTRKSFFLTRDDKGEVVLLSLQGVHKNSAQEDVPFLFEEESEGTQRLFHLVPALFQLKTKPRVLVIDELDRRLHPLLTRLFVQAALDCRDDAPHGQLLFTTHDTNLLDLDLLRRDEIWFVEKDPSGATHLASLAEWKVRPDLEIGKGYLNGRFGAIPFFGDISKLLCEPEEPTTANTNVATQTTSSKKVVKTRSTKTSVAKTSGTKTDKTARRKVAAE